MSYINTLLANDLINSKSKEIYPNTKRIENETEIKAICTDVGFKNTPS